MKKIALCVVGIYSFTLLSAQNPADSLRIERSDSLPASVTNNFGRRLDRFSSSRFYRMTYIGVPLVVGGLIVKSEDDHFRSLRNDYLPRFNRCADDYLQYAPGSRHVGNEGRRREGPEFVGPDDRLGCLLRTLDGKCGEYLETDHPCDAAGRLERPFFPFGPYGNGVHDGDHADQRVRA